MSDDVGEKRISLLWVDLTRSVREAALPPVFGELCDVYPCHGAETVDAALRRIRMEPNAVCFDFDYPDQRGLLEMQAAKIRFPHLPMLMVTLQHSESLAVWAFRSALWDYLVKPVSRTELEHCVASLRKLLGSRARQARRAPISTLRHFPDEAVSARQTTAARLMPAINYVAKNFRERIQSEQVARLCSMSPMYFSRKFKETFNIGFREYVVCYRIQEAFRILQHPGASVTDVCYTVGFNDPSYFTRTFKRYYGFLPSEAIGRTATDLPLIEAVADTGPRYKSEVR
jgi:AraC-like DNA-binding protein